jgi:hypothetical protein
LDNTLGSRVRGREGACYVMEWNVMECTQCRGIGGRKGGGKIGRSVSQEGRAISEGKERGSEQTNE